MTNSKERTLWRLISGWAFIWFALGLVIIGAYLGHFSQNVPTALTLFVIGIGILLIKRFQSASTNANR